MLWDTYDQARNALAMATSELSAAEENLNYALEYELALTALLTTAKVAEAQAAQNALSNKDTLGIAKEFYRDIKKFQQPSRLEDIIADKDAAVSAKEAAAKAYLEYLEGGKQDAMNDRHAFIDYFPQCCMHFSLILQKV